MELLETITLKDITNFIVGVIAVLSVVAEFSKKLPFKPISFIFSQIGKALTQEITTKLDDLDKQQKANNNAIIELENVVERRFNDIQRDGDEKESKRLRANIISFSDACRVGQRHTQNHFENVMRDYGDYMDYCEKHDFSNHFIESEYKYIEEMYQKYLRENSFL